MTSPIDDYIAGYPAEVQVIMGKVRAIILEEAARWGSCFKNKGARVGRPMLLRFAVPLARNLGSTRWPLTPALSPS